MSLLPFTTSVGWLMARSSEYRSPRGLRLAPMAALPECLAGRLACRGGREEQEKKIFERRHGIRRNSRNARIVRQLAIAGRGSDEDKAPHEFGMAQDDTLCNVAADGETKHVHGLQAQSADKARYVIGGRIDRVRGLAARA